MLRKQFSSVPGTGISKSEFKIRRAAIQQELGKNDVLIVPGYGLRYATGSIFYPFHQNTNFLYLTGFNEPNACMILKNAEFQMFVQPLDVSLERWDGKRIGFHGAIADYGADKAFSISELENVLLKLVNQNINIITDLQLNSLPSLDMLKGTHIDSKAGGATHFSSKSKQGDINLPANISKLGNMIDKFRMYKSANEQLNMQVSGRIIGNAFKKAMQLTKPGLSEHELHAILEYNVKIKKGTGLSYVPVVAGGKNSLILHYVQNNQILKDGDLVLVDAGAEYNFYASDVTRTWPVNGKFSKSQSIIYQLVLDCQKLMIQVIVNLLENCRIGFSNLEKLQKDTYRFLQAGISKLLGRRIEGKEMNELYPHHVGHYIGLDVHDCHTISRSLPFQEGMALTIEPGIYIPDDDIYGEFAGIGVRIEDDIIITGEGPLVLTAGAPKEINEIENLMNQ